MKELLPTEKVLLNEFVEREGLPNQSFSVPRVETAVDRIDKEIAGWVAIVVRVTGRIESLERLRKSVAEEARR